VSIGMALFVLGFSLWKFCVSNSTPTPKTQAYALAGTVWNEKGFPLEGVVVRLSDSLGSPQKVTDRNGHFRFQILSTNQHHVRLVAEKEGYRPYSADPTIGNEKLEFNMQMNP
jgi:hypothetical protein